ncbi:MAG: pitrilysin family protein [Thermodesulfobacteriota bacterium]
MSYTLPNGLKVILIENHRAPVVSMLTWIKVGSASEKPGEYGLAHLLEHMVFKGTARRGPGVIAREIEASGGQINAYTSYDQTVYYINMASRFAGRGLDVLADMVFSPALDSEEFRREKEVVIEEIRRSEDIPTRRLSKAVFGRAFKVHPYGRPVIGFSESVTAISRETAVEFHRRFYHPGNAVLVMAGDFDPEQIRTVILERFGRQPGLPVQTENRPVEPPQRESALEILRSDVKTATLDLAFHIPAFSSRETPALDLLAVIAGDGRTSRLYQRIKREKELAHEISAEAYTPRDPGLFIVNAQLSPEKTLSAVTAIMAELVSLGRFEVSPEELARAKLNVKASFIHSRATMSGEAQNAATFEVLAGDYRGREQYLAAVDRITVENIRSVAAKYLRMENMTLGLLVPQEADSSLNETALKAAAAQGLAQAASGVTGRKPETVIKEYHLKNGARLVVKADHSLPLAAVRAAFLGGQRYETQKDSGLNNFLAKVWDKGTVRRSAQALAKEIEDMAASLTSFSGRNSFGLEGEFLSQFLDRGLELFTEVLTSPALSQAEVDKARPGILAAIKRQDDEIASRTFRLFNRTLYAGHPYGLEQLGVPESVIGLTAQDLRAYYQRYVKPDNLVLAIAGDVDPDQIKKRLEELLEHWTGRSEPAPNIPAPATWTGLRKANQYLERAQAHLVLGFPAPGLDSPDRYALEVLDSILSGMGGRMFIKLRDERSLAYSLSSFYRPGLGPGSFGLYIAFDPAKWDQVQTGFREVLADLRRNPVSAPELTGAKEYLLGSYEIGLQSYGAQASELAFNELYGLGYDYSSRYLAGISAVTEAEVTRAAGQYLNLDHAVQVLVGPIKE